MMFHFNLHHITLILNGYLSNISCSPLPFGLLSSQVSGNGITFSHVELPSFRPGLKLIQGHGASDALRNGLDAPPNNRTLEAKILISAHSILPFWVPCLQKNVSTVWLPFLNGLGCPKRAKFCYPFPKAALLY